MCGWKDGLLSTFYILFVLEAMLARCAFVFVSVTGRKVVAHPRCLLFWDGRQRCPFVYVCAPFA